MLGPHASTTRAQRTRATGPGYRRKDGQLGEAEFLTPDTPHNGKRSPPLGQPAAISAAITTPQGTHAKGQWRVRTLAHPHKQRVGSGPRLPAPRTGSRGRTSAQPQTPLTTVPATPPWGPPPAMPTARNTGSHERTLSGRCLVPTPAPPALRTNGQQEPATRPKDRQPGEGERLTRGNPHNREMYSPAVQPPTDPAARKNPQGTHAKGPVPSPHTRTPPPTASGQWTPTACPKDGQPGQDEHLTVETPQIGRPPATPQYALPPPKSALCGASAASPRPRNPRPESTGNGSRVPAEKRRAAGRGRARHTRNLFFSLNVLNRINLFWG